jgi:hypothetical protein
MHVSHAYQTNFDWDEVQNIEKREEIKRNMLEFVKRLAYKMAKLFPYDDPLLKLISSLNPENFNFDNWNTLGERYTHLIDSNFSKFYKQIQKFETEKEMNKSIFESEEINKSLIKFYSHKIIKEKYDTMAKLANSILCLPFSNSEIERVFSQFKLTKTQLRTSLSDETIEGLMLWKMNSELLNINDEKILEEVCKMCEKIAINEEQKEKENNLAKSLKRKFDDITESKDQSSEILIQKSLKQSKLSQPLDKEQDQLSQEIIRLEIEKK